MVIFTEDQFVAMQYSKEEKLSLLFEMIEFAKCDDVISPKEFEFIMAVAFQLRVDREEVERLLREKPKVKILKSEFQRILQFHRLLLLMNIDKEYTEEEFFKIKNFGIQMGLRPEAINQILSEMHLYPDNIIPPDKIINIFRRFYN